MVLKGTTFHTAISNVVNFGSFRCKTTGEGFLFKNYALNNIKAANSFVTFLMQGDGTSLVQLIKKEVHLDRRSTPNADGVIQCTRTKVSASELKNTCSERLDNAKRLLDTVEEVARGSSVLPLSLLRFPILERDADKRKACIDKEVQCFLETFPSLCSISTGPSIQTLAYNAMSEICLYTQAHKNSRLRRLYRIFIHYLSNEAHWSVLENKSLGYVLLTRNSKENDKEIADAVLSTATTTTTSLPPQPELANKVAKAYANLLMRAKVWCGLLCISTEVVEAQSIWQLELLLEMLSNISMQTAMAATLITLARTIRRYSAVLSAEAIPFFQALDELEKGW